MVLTTKNKETNNTCTQGENCRGLGGWTP